MPASFPANRVNHDSADSGIPSRFRLFGTRSSCLLSQALSRNTSQVLNIVYGGVNPNFGLFFPKGVNGAIHSVS